MLRVTLVPTQARASEKENVIPSHAEVLVDCRVPPGMDEADARRRAVEVLGSPNGKGQENESPAVYELEFVEHAVGNRSPARSPLAEMIEAWLERADPGATLVPIVMAGFSDSNWFRRAFGSAVVYGFCPQREMSHARGGAAHPQRRRARRGGRHRPRDALLPRHRLGGRSDERRRQRPVAGARGRFRRERRRTRSRLRLGGMALRNGLLIHGPHAWAAAARTPDGRIEVSSGPKPAFSRGRLGSAPLIRGPLRLAEAFAVVPIARRGLPAARLPIEDPRVLVVALATAAASRGIRRLGPATAASETVIAALGVLPAVTALRDVTSPPTTGSSTRRSEPTSAAASIRRTPPRSTSAAART